MQTPFTNLYPKKHTPHTFVDTKEKQGKVEGVAREAGEQPTKVK